MVRTILLVSITSLTGLMVVVMEPILPAMRAHFRDVANVDVLVRLAATTASIGVAIGMPGAGWIMDRHGRKPVLLAGLVLLGLAGLAPLALNDLGAIIASRFAVGLGLGATLTAMLALVGDYYDPKGRASVFAMQAVVGAVGLFAFAILSGELAIISWRTPFALFAAPLAIAAAAIFAIADTKGVRVSEGGERLSRALVLGPWIGGVCLLLFLSNLATFTFITQMPFILEALGFADPRMIGLVTGVPAGIAALVGAVALPILARRVEAQRVFGVLLLGLFVSLVVSALARTPAHLLFAGFLATLAPSVLLPWGNLVALTVAPPGGRGMALALVGSAASVGQFVSPLIVQPLAEAIGLANALFVVAGACLLVGTPVLLARGGLRVMAEDKPAPEAPPVHV